MEKKIITMEIKCKINVMHLNHPETIPLTPPQCQPMENLSSIKLVPGVKKVGIHWSKEQLCANSDGK